MPSYQTPAETAVLYGSLLPDKLKEKEEPAIHCCALAWNIYIPFGEIKTTLLISINIPACALKRIARSLSDLKNVSFGLMILNTEAPAYAPNILLKLDDQNKPKFKLGLKYLSPAKFS